MHTLERYIKDILSPPQQQNDYLNGKIRKIKSIFEHNSNLPIKECHPSGSFNKNTMLRYKPELDLVFIIDSKYKKKNKSFKTILQESKIILEKNLRDIKIKKITNVAIKAQLKDRDNNEYDFDIVFSYLVNSPKQISNVKDKKSYQGAISIWNNEYVKQHISNQQKYPYARELIMLIKDWKNEHNINIPSYILELIVISAIEFRNIDKDNSWEDDLIECFKEIISMVDCSPIYPIEWKHFDEENLEEYKDEKVIIDAGNVNKNLANDIKEEVFKKLKSKASRAIYDIKKQNFDNIFNYKNQIDFKW